jgi:hypothetical protein
VRFSCVAPKAENNTRLLLLAGAAVLATGAVIALSLGGGGADYTTPTDELQPIELFEAAAPCPATEPAGAARRGEQLEQAAHAKRERYRFDAHDGLDAGRLFAQAANCYALSNDAESKARVEEVGNAWRQRVDEEFRADRLQLVSALQNKQDVAALAAVVSMRRILEGEPHPYATWLRKKELELKRALAKKKRRR